MTLTLLAALQVLRQLSSSASDAARADELPGWLHRTHPQPRPLWRNSRPLQCDGLARRRPQRQIDHPLNVPARQRRLAGLARLVTQQPFTPTSRHELDTVQAPRQAGLALASKRRMFSVRCRPAAAIHRFVQDNIGIAIRSSAARRDRPQSPQARRLSARVTWTTITALMTRAATVLWPTNMPILFTSF